MFIYETLDLKYCFIIKNKSKSFHNETIHFYDTSLL